MLQKQHAIFLAAAQLLIGCSDPREEALVNIRTIFSSASVYFDQTTQSGPIEAAQFPASTPLTPTPIPCGTRARTAPEVWSSQPSWAALGFSVNAPHRYSYQIQSEGVGATAQFTISAFGDLDCDGVYSTFVRYVGVLDGEAAGSAGLLEVNGLE